jgi:Mu-like prophage major head subunit gpT
MTTATAAAPGTTLQEERTWVATPSEPVTEAMINAGESGAPFARGRQRRDANPRYRQMLTEAFQLYNRVLSGDRYAGLQFLEAMSTSDFPALFGDIIDRQLLGEYQQMPVQWQTIARRGTVRDFRPVKRFAVDGAESPLPEVGELSEYPAAALTETPYEYRVTKRGRRVPLSWETWVNDDLGAFRSLPQRLATAARRTEERFATTLYATSTGPAAPFYSAANANIVTGNPALSMPGLQAAFTVLSSQVDTEGNPIFIDVAYLVVPPALEVTARNILNATQLTGASGGGVGNQTGSGADQLTVNNWMRDRVQLIVNPWLPLIDTTSGNTAWYLFGSPSAGRPAMEIGFLIGNESPALWQKSPNAVMVGGGTVDPVMGDFDTDSIQWRVRHVLGGVLLDPKVTVASQGDESS